ncbi:MAG TPA: TetR/AcrR family transcriptional regulator [Kofleriaceae bacterium]|nr:TetR/AcrR family transcriptional regulator [Kofleriaceae bacterium]
MPRPKEFSRDDVLERAMELFWRKGYEATSIGDLVEHLEIGRQSLYDTFGDKHALYVAALDRYREQFGEQVSGAFAADGPIKDVLRTIMRVVADKAAARPSQSCMLLGAVAERGPEDNDVKKRFCSNTSVLERALAQRLARARDRGELDSDHDDRALSRYLTNAMYGLQLLARGGADRKHVDQVIDVTLSMI